MRKILVAVAVLATAGSAWAAEGSGIKGSGTYGTAGCGLGSMAFGNQKGAIQILAATTNGLFGTQTFGITSGTSNCGERWRRTCPAARVRPSPPSLASPAAPIRRR